MNIQQAPYVCSIYKIQTNRPVRPYMTINKVKTTIASQVWNLNNSERRGRPFASKI